MKNNLILIIDKSYTNLLKRQEEIFQKWKINKEDVVKTTTWRKGLVQSKNLFGGVQAVWLDLSDAQAAMNFSKLIPTKKKLTEEKHLFNGKWWGNGVIITFLYPDKAINGKESSAGLAAIKNLVEYSGGTIEDNSSKRVDTLKTDVLKNIPKEEIQKFTIQDVAVYLPAKSGVKLPWDVTGALDRHNLALALDCYNRMVNNKVPMFGLISWLNRHYQLAYEVASLLESGVPRRDISKSLPKQNSYAISNTIRDLESNGTYPKAETLEYILKQTTELNLYYKGELRCIDKDNHFRNVLAKIYQALRCNAPLQY